MWSTILSQLSSTGSIPWDDLDDHRHTLVTQSEENDYLASCKIILMKLDQASMAVVGRETLLDDIILKKKIDLLIVLCNQFYGCQELSYRRDKLLDLMIKFLYKKNHLEDVFGKIGEEGLTIKESSPQLLAGDELNRCLINLPSNVANKMQLKTPQSLLPVNYFTRLTQVIFHCLVKVHNRLKRGQDSHGDFVCKLLGKISSSGYPDIVFKCVTKPLIEKCQDDFIWRRIGHKLVTSQSDRDLESIVRPIFINLPEPTPIKWMLKDFPKTNEKLRYILTKKFILVYFFEEPRFVVNLIGYLNNVSEDLFLESFENLLMAWSNASGLKHRSNDQQMYICSGLAVCAKYLSTMDISKSLKDRFVKSIIYAIEVYLKCVLVETRNTGLYIGQLLLSILEKEGPKLDLEIDTIPEVTRLIKLYGSEAPKIKNDAQEDETEAKKEMDESLMEDDEGEDPNKNKVLDSDDDDDLVPYDMSNDIPLSQSNKPTYLRDCISGLQEADNPDWTRICLENAVQIIEKNKSMIEDFAEDFARTLLHLNDSYETPNFVELRRDALVKLCQYSPVTVASYLAGQFYDRNMVMQRRLDILEVLAMASQEISKSSKDEEPSTSSSTETQLIQKILPHDVVIAESKWKSVVEERIQKKTRIISKPRKEKTYVNKFASVAGHFFFPLMKTHHSPDITFNLMGDDYYLLGRLLYTLGIILDAASQSPITRRMGKSLLEFLWAFRYHVESFVRQAIIFCFCIILTAVPRVHLIEHMQNEIIEFQRWLMDVTEKDPDKECIKRAYQALFLLKELVDSGEKSDS